MALAVVRDLRVARAPATPDDLDALETDVLAGFVLARAAAGLSDGTISSDVMHLEQVRAWFGRPLWDMDPADADTYFGKVLRATAKGTRLALAQALKTYFLFLELRHKVEIHQATGRVVECPIDEMNRPRGGQQPRLRIPPTADQVSRLFAGWREELSTCRKSAQSVRTLLDRLIIALAAIHAARPKAIREFQLDDVDLGNRGLTIAGRTRPLDELTRQIILQWLGYRNHRWPSTANQHLLINKQSAMETGPVSKVWMTESFRGQAATLERLRVHRQLDEALVTGADPLHLATVFGLDPKTAIRYADSARKLLITLAEEQDPPSSDEPKGQNHP
ncbi:hypothetical protein [Nonomuraea rubra]|uniref:Integrase n=1 Tax=Nonomuraea rubra TaxID=46180 RepID=A0A7X0NX20_9ACTN|nr:hypothetical protein [Nonomuraea rubra]MBB6551198.1 integrase [Nonomuraea rubra]